jgi:PPM family protein phosphatase
MPISDLRVVLRSAAVSSAGPRPVNQDSACAGAHLVAIADGVGGNVGGAVASSLVIDWLIRHGHRPLYGATEVELGPAIAGANDRLRAVCTRRPHLKSMATTLTAAAVTPDGRLTLGHIGDSRAYLLRDGALVQLTRDHTWVQVLVDAGTLSRRQAARHPMRSVLLAVLHGSEDDLLKVETSTHVVHPGDRLLLCSDGLSSAVDVEQLRRILAAEPDPVAAASALLQAALDAPAQDNVTLVVADVTTSRHPACAPTVVVGAVAAGNEATQPAVAIRPGA